MTIGNNLNNRIILAVSAFDRIPDAAATRDCDAADGDRIVAIGRSAVRIPKECLSGVRRVVEIRGDDRQVGMWISFWFERDGVLLIDEEQNDWIFSVGDDGVHGWLTVIDLNRHLREEALQSNTFSGDRVLFRLIVAAYAKHSAEKQKTYED
ncbi:MAG: hypothetical protein WBQ72_06135 [Terriglobales bacterium]|jgi:hypothetical protein